MIATPAPTPGSAPASRATLPSCSPRLGFLGAGWIGRHRMRALLDAGAEVVAVCDPSPDASAAAAADAGGCPVVPGLDALLALGVDGVVVATPSALHADQAVAALEAGVAVFCHEPLARTAAEARRVVDAARAADRLLGVDLSYRHVAGVPEMRRLVSEGALGKIYAADLVFHSAYGPDRDWLGDARLSGGGCLMDLGLHLLDLALWVLGFPEVHELAATLRAGGRPIRGRGSDRVEDYAAIQAELANGSALRLACSWWLSAGQDCVVEAAFHGTAGGVSLRNVGGSAHDFVVERHAGTRREAIAGPPDAWGGRAAVAWARALARGGRFDPEVAHAVEVQATLDRIYEL